MIEGIAIPRIGDPEQQGFDPAQVEADGLGRLTGFHHAGVEQVFAVTHDLEHDGGRPGGSIIHADAGGEAFGATREFNPEGTVGMRADAVFELLAGDREGFLADGLIDLGFAVALAHGGEIESFEPNGFGRCCREDRGGEESEGC